MLRVRDVYPGSEFFHPGSRVKKILDPGSRIRIHVKLFKYFLSKQLFLSSRQYDPGCHPGYGSRIRILIFYLCWISDPGVKKAPDLDPQHFYLRWRVSAYQCYSYVHLHYLCRGKAVFMFRLRTSLLQCFQLAETWKEAHRNSAC